MMKGIKLCIECGNYDTKNHKCRIGCSKETNPQDPFYDDCPLPDVAPVEHGEWRPNKEPLGAREVDVFECSVCGDSWIIDEDLSFEECTVFWNYCPTCGALMDGGKG